MIQPGKIRIKGKVYFEPDGLEKPDKENYYGKYMPYFDDYSYYEDMKEYEASKQLIEVSNEHAVGNIYPDSVYIYIENKLRKAKNNDPCKAKITRDTCNIIELL